MRVRSFAKALAATIALGALLAGVPYVLCRFVGWPLPRHVPTWHAFTTALGSRDLSDQAIIDVLAVALWLCWTVLLCAFSAEAVALRRRREIGRLPVAGRLQPLAGALLGTIVLGLAALTVRPSGSGVGPARAAVVQPVRPPVGHGRLFGTLDTEPTRAELTVALSNGRGTNGPGTNGPGANGTGSGASPSDLGTSAASTNGRRPNGDRAPRAQPRASTDERTYVVRDDDTLWGIAAHELGDATRWEAIYALNRGVLQPGGGALDNPHWIYPGWVLRLPSEPAPSTAAPSSPPTSVSSVGPTGPAVPAIPTSIGPATADPSPGAPAATAAPRGPVAPGASGRAEPTAATNGANVGATGPSPGPSLGPTVGRTGPPAPAADGPARQAGPDRAVRSEADQEEAAPRRTAAGEAPVELSSGGRVGGALVLAVLGALVALRFRRRQRYRPRAPRPGRDLGAPALTPTLRDLLGARRIDADDAELGEVAALSVVPDLEERATPDRIEVGRREGTGETVELTLGAWPGLVVGGPGAEATLRAILAALLARSGPYNVEVVTTAALAAHLLAGLDVSATVQEKSDAEGVVGYLEARLVAEARQLEQSEHDDAASYRAANPADPYPLVLALTNDVPGHLAGRWQALCASATRYGAAALVLGDGGPAPSVEDGSRPRLRVSADGRVAEASPVALAAELASVVLFRLDREECADLLAPIVAVHNYGGTSYEGPDDEPAPEDRTGDEWSEEAWTGEQTGETDAASASEAEPRAGAVPVVETHPADPPVAEPPITEPPVVEPPLLPANPSWHDASWPEPRAVTAWEGERPVVVRLLGPACIEAYGALVRSRLRRSAYELLAWFALRPEGATLEAAADALWPDADRERAREYFWNALGSLRRRAGKRPGSDSDALELLVRVGEHYVPDAAVLDVDLWRFEASLRAATEASEEAEVAAALDAALACYGGDFCPGADYLWSEPARADLHHRALDAAFALAELHERAGRHDAALGALERALGIDPVCEAAARRLAEGHVGAGRLGEAIEVGVRLRRSLALVELEPSEGTGAYFARLRQRQRDIERHEARREQRRTGGVEEASGDEGAGGADERQ